MTKQKGLSSIMADAINQMADKIKQTSTHGLDSGSRKSWKKTKAFHDMLLVSHYYTHHNYLKMVDCQVCSSLNQLTQEEISQGWTINEAGQKSVGRVWTEIL